ncbi:MAG: Rap1a immunity protein [Myxococcaceae bacterium]|nr:Rap1a immunity protein [Myxococcaceae bacterium]
MGAMWRCIWVLVAFSAASSFASSASASMTAEELMWGCVQPSDDGDVVQQLKYVACSAYVNGAFDMLAFAAELAPGRYCPPAGGLSTEEVLRVVMRWIRSNPAAKHASARVAVLSALFKAYPCESLRGSHQRSD